MSIFELLQHVHDCTLFYRYLNNMCTQTCCPCEGLSFGECKQSLALQRLLRLSDSCTRRADFGCLACSFEPHLVTACLRSLFAQLVCTACLHHLYLHGFKLVSGFTLMQVNTVMLHAWRQLCCPWFHCRAIASVAGQPSEILILFWRWVMCGSVCFKQRTNQQVFFLPLLKPGKCRALAEATSLTSVTCHSVCREAETLKVVWKGLQSGFQSSSKFFTLLWRLLWKVKSLRGLVP